MVTAEKFDVESYEFRQLFAPKGIDPETAAMELRRIADLNDGELTPAAVLDAARDDASPLHAAFEWNDSVAAEAHRRWQARTLIKCIRVVREDRPASTPMFVRVERGGYQETARVVEVADILDRAIREVNATVSRAAAAVHDLRRAASAVGRAEEAEQIIRDAVQRIMI